MSDHWNSLANLLGTPNLKPRGKKSVGEDVASAPVPAPATTPNPAAQHDATAAPIPTSTPPAPTARGVDSRGAASRGGTARGGKGASKKQAADQVAVDHISTDQIQTGQLATDQTELPAFGGDLISADTASAQAEDSKRTSRRSPRGSENRGRQGGKRGAEFAETQEPVADVVADEVLSEPQVEMLSEVVSEKAPSVLRTSWDAVANFFGMGGGDSAQESQKSQSPRNPQASQKDRQGTRENRRDDRSDRGSDQDTNRGQNPSRGQETGRGKKSSAWGGEVSTQEGGSVEASVDEVLERGFSKNAFANDSADRDLDKKDDRSSQPAEFQQPAGRGRGRQDGRSRDDRPRDDRFGNRRGEQGRRPEREKSDRDREPLAFQNSDDRLDKALPEEPVGFSSKPDDNVENRDRRGERRSPRRGLATSKQDEPTARGRAERPERAERAGRSERTERADRQDGDPEVVSRPPRRERDGERGSREPSRDSDTNSARRDPRRETRNDDRRDSRNEERRDDRRQERSSEVAGRNTRRGSRDAESGFGGGVSFEGAHRSDSAFDEPESSEFSFRENRGREIDKANQDNPRGERPSRRRRPREDDSEVAAVDSGEFEDRDEHQVRAGRIPSWEETVGVLIEANMENHKRTPSGGGGRPRRGRSGNP